MFHEAATRGWDEASFASWRGCGRNRPCAAEGAETADRPTPSARSRVLPRCRRDHGHAQAAPAPLRRALRRGDRSALRRPTGRRIASIKGSPRRHPSQPAISWAHGHHHTAPSSSAGSLDRKDPRRSHRCHRTGRDRGLDDRLDRHPQPRPVGSSVNHGPASAGPWPPPRSAGFRAPGPVIDASGLHCERLSARLPLVPRVGSGLEHLLASRANVLSSSERAIVSISG